jgi:hypothetical protein
MRLRHATLAVAVLTVLSVAGCGDDSDDPAPVAPAPSVSAGPSTDGALGGPAASADPGTPPTEGTSTAKPPKKGGGAAQGPAGKPAATP